MFCGVFTYCEIQVKPPLKKNKILNSPLIPLPMLIGCFHSPYFNQCNKKYTNKCCPLCMEHLTSKLPVNSPKNFLQTSRSKGLMFNFSSSFVKWIPSWSNVRGRVVSTSPTTCTDYINCFNTLNRTDNCNPDLQFLSTFKIIILHSLSNADFRQLHSPPPHNTISPSSPIFHQSLLHL